MNVSRCLKDNRFVRGLYSMWHQKIGNIKRKRFGFIGDHVLLILLSQGILSSFMTM